MPPRTSPQSAHPVAIRLASLRTSGQDAGGAHWPPFDWTDEREVDWSARPEHAAR